MEEKEKKRVVREKNINEIIMIVFMALTLLLGWYYIRNEFLKEALGDDEETSTRWETLDEKPTPTPNLITDQEAEKLGKELYTDAVSILFKGDKLNLSTDSSDYISSSSEKCNKGIGCQKITNWEEVSSIFTQNLISKLDYKGYRKFSVVVIIDNTAYRYDGDSARELEKIDSVKVKSKEENKIVYTIESYFKEDGGLLMDENGNMITEHSKDTATMIIVKENNKWKVDSLVESSLLLNSNVD